MNKAVQMDNEMILLDTKNIDRIPNAPIRELQGKRNRVNEGPDEGVLG